MKLGVLSYKGLAGRTGREAMSVRSLLLPALALAAAILIGLTWSTGKEVSGQTTGLHIRMVIYGPSGGPAPAGTIVRVLNSGSNAVCRVAPTVNGLAEITVEPMASCPIGTAVYVSVTYPGSAPEVKPVEPPLKGGAVLPTDHQPLTLVVGAPPLARAPAPPPGAFEDSRFLRYSLMVNAPDGTLVSLYRVTPERPPPGAVAPASKLCADAVVQNGKANLVVMISADCPVGGLTSIILFERPGIGITASSTPQIEWREPRPGELSPIDAVVRVIPPNTGSAGLANRPSIIPPGTGSGGLLKPDLEN